MKTGLQKELKTAYKKIKNAVGSNGASEWLYDNFYLVDRYYRFALENRRALSCRNFYEVLKRFCEDRDYTVTAKSLSAYLSGNPKSFSFYELCALKDLLAVCAITKIADLIDEKKGMSLLPKTVKLLISLTEPDFDDMIPEIWRAEPYLERFEEGYVDSEPETKAQYRALISKYASENCISESDAVVELAKKAKSENLTLGKLLFAPKRKYVVAWGLVWLAVFSLLFGFALLTVGWVGVLLAVPFGIAASSVADHFVSLFAPAYKPPRKKLDSVPAGAKTLVAVASLLTGGEGDLGVFESLVRFRYMNPDENIFFCLLADLPDSDQETENGDNSMIESAKKKIDELNSLHGERFCLFLRKRVLNKSENRFGGWERKRGAVCELVSHIVRGDKTDYYYGGEFIKDVKYLLTLDSDTNLSVGSVRELLSVALHPVNRPISEEGRVVSGYAIIQPTVRTELASAYKTGFSRLISGAGGADVYSTASFIRSQSLLGSGNFCGKGLIDVNLFDSLVSEKIPEGLVLSHDVVEGSIMRTMCASDITLTDSTPGNTVSFFRRLHRWLRGDFQNLFFIKGKTLPLLSKSRILLTVVRHSSPIFSLLAVAIGSFWIDTNGFWLFFLAYSEFFVPCAFGVVGFLFSGSPFAVKRFFSKASSMLAQTFLRLAFELSSCCRKAVLTLNAFFLASVRLVTRKKTLEWTTAAQAEKLSSTLGKYVLDSALSVTVGLLLMIFAIPPFLKFAGLLYFVYPFVSAVLSRPLDESAEVKSKLSAKSKKLLMVHVHDMFRFYADNVNETTNHLPPDNVQFSPVSATAYRTSPTNIGFYLVSLLAARDIGILTSKELAEKLEKSVSVIEKLEKYKGNLFNWYDIKNLSVIGNRYVSSVDSGNFIVMLVALKEGILEYKDEEVELENLSKRIEALINECDLTSLYDSRKNLFRIGAAVNGDEVKFDSNCYDLLMSEARMLAFYSVASSGVPKKHWQTLGRTLTHGYGYLGMMSWSGTAFEYLMPLLFMPLYKNSFLFESVLFSMMVQKNENSLWGVSESGFYSFDSDMNYQYKANGIKNLALRRVGGDERIVSPYSTYLSLTVSNDSGIKNLKEFENRGMYGKYGLYEALDMNDDPSGICVKSYMAHHVGMSIIACMNAIDDNIFVRRFMRDIRMYSANELLQEKIPIDAHVFADTTGSQKESKRPVYRTAERKEKIDLENPFVKMLTKGDLTALVSSSGHIGLQAGEKKLFRTEFEKYSLMYSPAVIFSRNGKNYGCVPLYEKSGCGFEHGNGFASHIASGRDFSGRVRYSISKKGNCFVVNTRAETLKKYDVTFVFEPMLETEKKYLSHISFSKLFIESEYDETKRILYFHRRSGLDGRHIFTLAVAPRDKDTKFSFLTSREPLSASSVDSSFDYASMNTDNSVGACLDPLCLVRSTDSEGGRATFLVTCGETKGECERNIRLARSDRNDHKNENPNATVEKILPALLYGSGGPILPSFTKCGIGDLWSRGISGDYPLCVISASEIAVTRTKAVLKAFFELSRSFLRCELIFLIHDEDNYNRPVESSVRDCLSETRTDKFIGKRGGIFILRENELGKDFVTALKNTAKYFSDFSRDFEPNRENRRVEQLEIISTPKKASPIPIPENSLASKNGFFLPEGFVVDKTNLPDAPYSYVLSGYRFSTVVTQSSLGYTFFDNARERRICSFYGDARSLDGGERVFLVKNGKKYDLCAVSNKVRFEKGCAVYEGEVEGIGYSMSVVVPPKFPVKLIRVKLARNESANLSFELKPVMGDGVRPCPEIETVGFSTGSSECMMFRNPFGMTFPEGRGFAGAVGGKADTERKTLFGNGNDILFFLGACTNEGGAVSVASRVSRRFFDSALHESREFVDKFLPKIKITTKSKTHDAMFNFFLPYQTAICRFFARGSFYQSGGAYGFRDQLQDSLSIVFSSPKTVRTHIIRCCAHQYTDGSVMHWWHTRNYGGVNRGIKSKCSDDLLYLPIVVADYIEKTGDESLLDVPVFYLTSPELTHENERYEQPARSDERENVFRHCLRALSRADRRGKNGLILMGSCDWNDGFSLVGEKGVGESVFSTMLFIVAIEAFLPLIEKFGDGETYAHYEKVKSELKNALEERAFFGDRYARAFADDGTVLGIEGSGECEIDVLSQSFAALAHLDEERTKKALKRAFNELYDSKNKIFRLFSPPFANGRVRVGYIRGYVSGIRENGGQYSHGALFGALGCFEAGMNEEGLLILDCINPALRSNDKDLAKKYKNEPYAVSADIYSGEHAGRGGWSWYTGASGWYYRIMLEWVLGLKLGAGRTLLSAEPIIPFEAEATLDDAELKIIATETTKTPTLDGAPISFPLSLPSGSHILELPIKKA